MGRSLLHEYVGTTKNNYEKLAVVDSFMLSEETREAHKEAPEMIDSDIETMHQQ